MARCKHSHIQVSEEHSGFALHHLISNGKLAKHCPEPNDLDATGRIEVTCFDCHRTWRFCANRKTWPKWVQEAFDIAIDVSDLED